MTYPLVISESFLQILHYLPSGLTNILDVARMEAIHGVINVVVVFFFPSSGPNGIYNKSMFTRS